MPIYRYACGACGREFEVIQRRDETGACPSCGSEQVARKLSVVARPQSGGAAVAQAMPGACGTCGDPRGPGSCSMN